MPPPFRSMLGTVMVTALAMWPVAAQAPSLAMLDGLSKGKWMLHLRDDAGEQRVCLRDARDFIQLRHPQTDCSRFVVEAKPDEVDVQYTCRGHGYGRTSIRRESKTLVQIQSRGLVDGAPFAIDAEGRYIGAC